MPIGTVVWIKKIFLLNPSDVLALVSHSDTSCMNSIFNTGCGYSFCRNRSAWQVVRLFKNIITSTINIYLKDIITSHFKKMRNMFIPDLFTAKSTTQRQFSVISCEPSIKCPRKKKSEIESCKGSEFDMEMMSLWTIKFVPSKLQTSFPCLFTTLALNQESLLINNLHLSCFL